VTRRRSRASRPCTGSYIRATRTASSKFIHLPGAPLAHEARPLYKTCPMSRWAGITGLVRELKRCEDAGHLTGALILAYVCIDTMAFLSLPEGESEQTRTDFIRWVDTYLKAHDDQPYQYRGIDVYAARCAVLHAFSSETERHRKDPTVRVFGYHSGGKHAVNPAKAPRVVMIGAKSFLNDVVLAVEAFLRDCEANDALRARVDARLDKVLQTFPITAPGSTAPADTGRT